MKIVVTGAGGFIGRPLCRALVERGIEVRGTARAPAAGMVATGDLSEETDWSEALQGADAVVHLANRAHVLRETAAAFVRANVGGTVSLARAAARAGVRRIVYVSSLKVHGDRSGDRPLREDDPLRPAGDPYGESKHDAERQLRSLCDAGGVEHVVVRPPLVYGPRVRANFLSLLRAVDRGVPLPLAAVRNQRSLVGVNNLVDALAACAVETRAAGETFFVADQERVSTPELVRAVAAALGRPARLFPVPVGALRLIGAVTHRRGVVQRLVDSLAVDTSRIQERLGWRPPRTMREELAATAEWYRETSKTLRR